MNIIKTLTTEEEDRTHTCFEILILRPTNLEEIHEDVHHLLPSGCTGCSLSPGLLYVARFRRALGVRWGT